MAVNPNIALSLEKIQLPDPLSNYLRFSEAKRLTQENALARDKVKKTDALNKIYAESIDPATNEIDLNALRANAARSGIGSAIPEIEKSYFDSRQSKTNQEKAMVELIDAKLKQSRQFLDTVDPNDPEAGNAFIAWHEANHKDPVIGPILAARGITADQSRAKIMAALEQGPATFAELLNQSKLGTEKFMELNKPSQSSVDLGGQTKIIQTPGLGGSPVEVASYEEVPLPKDVADQKTRMAKAGATNVNVNTQKQYAETVAKAAADEDIATYKNVQAIPKALAKIDETISILENEDVTTGIGADVFNIIDKAKAKFANDKKAGKRVESTEYLDSLLGSDVFPQISNLGIGSKGLDTPAEREFLRKVMTGSVNLDKGTLIKMAELRRKGLEDTLSNYNERVDRGELDNFFNAAGRKKSRVEAPKRPDRKSQAPQRKFAKDKKGNVIYSDDGEKTWINSKTGERVN